MKLYRDLTFIPLLVSLIILGATMTILEHNMAVPVIYSIWLTLGLVIISFSFHKRNKFESVKLFFLFFVIFCSYMFVTDYFYVDNPYTDYFRAPDSITFYRQVDSVLKSSSAGYEELSRVLFISRNWPAFGVIIWSTGKLAYAIDVNSLLVQKLQLVFLTSLIGVFLYNTSRIYLDRSKAWIIAVTYGFFTHLFFYSAVFIRDIHISFVYIAGFYLLLSPDKNLRKLLFLGGLFLLASLFRLQHGIFFLTFIGVYLFLYLRNNRNNIAFLFLGIAIMIGFGSSLLFYGDELYEDVAKKVIHYQELHGEKLEDATGLGATFSTLPSGLRQGFFIISSQISPFPFYSGFYSTVLDEYRLLYFPLCIAGFYWIIVWGFVWYGLLKPKLRGTIPIELKSILLIALILIVSVGATSPEERRIMCVYPAVYLFAGLVFFKIPKRKRQLVSLGMVMVYICLLGLYLGLKMITYM